MPVQLVSIMGGGLAGQSATFLRGFGEKIFCGIIGNFSVHHLDYTHEGFWESLLWGDSTDNN